MHPILVIGTGFLGSHVVEHLLNAGRYLGTVFDINEPEDESRFGGVSYIQGSIIDATHLANVVKEVNSLVVLHTASPVHGLLRNIYYEVNEMGTRNVIDACRAAEVKKLIYTSSTGVVWTGAEFNGGLGERLVLAAQANATSSSSGVSRRSIHDKKQHGVQIGDNTNLVDYAYAGNVAHAHVRACAKLISHPARVSGQTFFITNGDPRPQWDFARLIWKETTGMAGSCRSRVSLGSSWLCLRSVCFVTGTQWYNIDKARDVLGYEPSVSLEEGVRRTVKWWKQTGSAQHKLRTGQH
ncbi:hypothetical protein B0H17DRAFT_1199583 [Mycena rosella]|uniref:3-beta hydroxysteroid dehydrogenase/isomerase domain-containing protein n=1 Tax=Mycena rosella TaxID=1033263 RepID=A0AAD7DKI9_MYCRO|nr:hypothetical protein B0H17DRAFT_1199583 [Mycena rosella]